MNTIATRLALLLLLPAASVRAAVAVKVLGDGESAFTAKASSGPSLRDARTYDAVVVGGGLAGLSAALYLSDHGKTVLLLEKSASLGGLAAGGTNGSGVSFNRGAAYWTNAYEEEQKILEHIGLGGFRDMHAISEPADSYLWKGVLYPGLWEEETLHKLPASFALFKNELKWADKDKLIPNQPFEESANLELDAFSATDWIRGMPARAAARADEESKKIYARFLADKSLDKADPMKDVLGLMDMYCRSALGTVPSGVSAAAFANFYISEIETRYTTPHGTGEAAEMMERTLGNRRNLVTIKTSAVVDSIVDASSGVIAGYVQNGTRREALAGHAVFAAQLKFAPKIIAGLAQADPWRAQLMRDLGYAHYSVHVVRVKGHPYRATFDTWTRAADYTEKDFTDVILGRWMDPAVRGYEGMRDFKKDPPDDQGILSIYHPLPPGAVGSGYTESQAAEFASAAVERMTRMFSPLLKDAWGTTLDVQSVETNRWPYSVHIAKPGHFGRDARILRRRYGHVFFANNNLGTPSFEEALFRGHCAANNILARLDADFEQESWSRCPLEP